MAEDLHANGLKVQATITIFSVGEVPSNAREKNLGVLYPRSG
jgi:hypothetical protein